MGRWKTFLAGFLIAPSHPKAILFLPSYQERHSLADHEIGHRRGGMRGSFVSAIVACRNLCIAPKLDDQASASCQ